MKSGPTWPLSGTGLPPGPVVTLSATVLTFAGQAVGTTSAAQSVVLANTGNQFLTITSITASGDFAQTNDCGSAVAAGANCTVSVTFSPTASGPLSGSVTITTNATGSPHAVALSGSGTNFSITPGSASATIAPGQTAIFSLSLVPAGGFSESVTLTCTGAPVAALCTASPSSMVLNTTANVTVSVITTAPRALLLPQAPRGRWPELAPWTWLAVLLSSLAAAGLSLRQRRRWAMATAVLLAMLSASCAGGVGVPPPVSQTAGTPAGTYTLTVTATASSGISRTATLNLTVQ